MDRGICGGWRGFRIDDRSSEGCASMKVKMLAPQGRGRAEVFVRCPRHLEDLLASELEALGLTGLRLRAGGVQVGADLRQATAICVHSRLASRVLWPLAAFPAVDADALHAGVARLDWASIIREGATLAVGFDGTSRELRHTGFAAQRIKDAVVDVLRASRGSRPDVDPRRPDLRLQGVLHRERVTLYLDLAGTALHRRGWRDDGGAAPVKENLAAGLLLRAGWSVGEPDWLVDPLCGSGTLLVEGALIAAGIAPGVLRERFGFEAFGATPEGLRAELEAALPPPRGPVRLFGRDADADQVARTRQHLERAGAGTRFEAEIDLAVERVERLDALPAPLGLVAANPPYGARMDEAGVLPALGRLLQRHAAGSRVAILVGQARGADGRPAGRPDEALTRLDLAGLERHPCRNGPLEARMLTGRIEGAPGSVPVDAAALEHARMFANRVRKNGQRLGRWARRRGIEAYRLYDRDLPEYAFVVDRYGDALCVQEFRPPATVDPVMAARRRDAALAVLGDAAGVEEDAIHFRERRRQRPEEQYGVHDRRVEERIVAEEGARFRVNLSDYLDTGLYPDSRGVRRHLREAFDEGGGGRFLNLFAYTGTATVQAALGGAEASVSVDLSRTYLDWMLRQFELNDLDPAAHRRVRSDVLEWLTGPGRDEEPFDLILLDPPTFSNSARTEHDLDIQRDQARLLDAALALLAPGGELVLVVHARRFRLHWTRPAGVQCDEITRRTLDEDCARGHPAHRSWSIRRV
jgi:23S rRNA (guanine2445-N2)-methyltransferase / 23S rRNA (guanine2069-N7)-methyltransferase